MEGLGDVYMDKLHSGMIKDWLAAMAARYSGWTCHGLLRVLRTMTRDAQADLRLPFWPCERVTAPKPLHEYTDEEPNALTASELGALWDAMRVHEPRWFPLFALMATTGMRFAEATALQWSDVDFDEGILHVRRNQVRKVVGTTKTKGSRRRIPLVPELADILREHRAALIRDENPGLLGDWVFPSSTGTLLSAGAMRKPLLRSLQAAGIGKRLTPHGLRRTLNTLALEIAPAETVRRIMGHTTSAMTAHYNAPDLAARRSVLDQVIDLVRPPESAECGDPGGDQPGGLPTLN
jgi:integrase